MNLYWIKLYNNHLNWMKLKSVIHNSTIKFDWLETKNVFKRNSGNVLRTLGRKWNISKIKFHRKWNFRKIITNACCWELGNANILSTENRKNKLNNLFWNNLQVFKWNIFLWRETKAKQIRWTTKFNFLHFLIFKLK